MTHTTPMTHHNPRRPVGLRAPRLIVAAFAALFAMPGMVRAQEPVTLPALQQAPVEQQALPGEKSPGKALAYSLVGTGVGVGIMFAAEGADMGPLGGVGALLAFAGPNFGHLYAGENATAATHIGVRAGAGGAVLVGAVWTLVASCTWGFFGEESHCDAPPAGAAVLMVGGAVVSTGSSLYSIYDAPRAARRANARMRASQLTLTPAPVAGPDGTSGLGMHLAGQF